MRARQETLLYAPVVVLQFCCVHTIESRLATLRVIGAVQFQEVTKGGKGSDSALVLAVAA